MAKTKVSGGRPAALRNLARDKASDEEAQLRAYHALGKKVLALDKDAKPGEDPVKKIHEKTGYGLDTLRKARVFAKVYTEAELDELCKLRMPDQGLRANMPLAWRLVRQMLMVPAGEKREALQRKAAERGWSPEELRAEIPQNVRRGQTRRGGGRAFQRPQTDADALRQVVRHGEDWLRRYRKAWETFKWLAGKPGAAGPGGLKARIAEARQTLKALGEAVRTLDARIKGLERKLAVSKGERE